MEITFENFAVSFLESSILKDGVYTNLNCFTGI